MTGDSYGRPEGQAFVSSRNLRKVSTWDLGCALLQRLRASTAAGSRVAVERQVALFHALHEALGHHLEVPENRFATSLLAEQFRFVQHCVQQHGLPLQGAVHVDIGCGAINPYARLFMHLLLGLRSACGLEPEPVRDEGLAVRALARLASTALLDPKRLYGDFPVDARQILDRLHGFDLARLEQGDPRGLDRERLRLERRPLADTGLPAASVDVTLSNSVLEHIADVPASLAELARITRVGGFGIHGIDVADHRVYGDPEVHRLEFLAADARLPMFAGSNRLRLFEFERLFADHGFVVLDRWAATPIEIPASLRARLVMPWRAMTDAQLATVWTQYLIRRT